jgi:hypothetical protein
LTISHQSRSRKRRNRVWVCCWFEACFGSLKNEEQTELMDVWMAPIKLHFSIMSSPRVRSSRSWQSWYWVAEFEKSMIKPNLNGLFPSDLAIIFFFSSIYDCFLTPIMNHLHSQTNENKTFILWNSLTRLWNQYYYASGNELIFSILWMLLLIVHRITTLKY